jgi:glycosyltransferase involved in cell wall biosynthesis
MQLTQLVKKEKVEAIFSSHLGFLRVAAALRVTTGVKAWFHLGLPATKPPLSTRLALKFLGGGISPAAHTRETWAVAGWPTKRLHLVRNFVDPEKFRPAHDKRALRVRLALPKDRALIGYIGRLVPEKGVETLIDAFNLLAPDAPAASLLILGRGKLAYVEALAERCLFPDRLQILPPTPATQDYFAAIDIACVPSKWAEPFPLVMGEAMASSVPVVCSDVGVLAEIIGEESRDLVAPAGDSRALAAALLRLLRLDDLGAARGEALRKRAIELFGPKDVIDAYERIMAQ